MKQDRRNFLATLASLLTPLTIRGKAEGQQPIPKSIPGVELTEIEGWLATRYFWRYKPEESTVHPLPSLRNAGEYPSPRDIDEESRLLTQLGSGADILEYNPNPASPDHNNWLRSIFRPDSGEATGRPFFLAWEHVYGTRYQPVNGTKDMSLPNNRRWFEEDLEFMIRNVIMPCQSRYVTLGGRAVIYLWSMGDMAGDFGSLLEELRAKYPVTFIGAVNILYPHLWQQPWMVPNLQALDGFMEYSLFPSAATLEEEARKEIAYSRMVTMHKKGTESLQSTIQKWEETKKRKYLLGSTMQFAFDDTKVSPVRGNLPMYAQNVKEVTDFAQRLKDGKEDGTYAFGPLVVWDEFPEGGAALPSQCLPGTIDRPDRFVGCGYARTEIVRQFFGAK